MYLYWHRRTLQARQNPALSTAFSAAERNDSSLLPLFVLDDKILSHADGLRVAFMLGSLGSLRDWYRSHGSDLVIRHGAPTDVVGRIAQSVDAERVVWNDDSSRVARRRDRAVQRALARSDVAYTSVRTQPGGVDSATRLPPDPGSHLADPHALGVETGGIPRLSDLGDGDYDSAPLTVGTESARRRLRALSNGRTYRRHDDAG